MAGKFHVSKDGKVRPCTAQSQEACTAVGLDNGRAKHFDSELDGVKYVESTFSHNIGMFKTVSVKVPENTKIRLKIPTSVKNSSINKLSNEEKKRQLGLEEKYFRNLLKKQEPLEDIDSPETKALKVLNVQDLGKILLNVGKEEGYSKDIYKAIRMATILHKDQKRLNRGQFERAPYIEHPLRNAVRISRWGVKDKETIIAAVLHDTIEDGSENYVKLYENEDVDDGLVARGRLGKEIEDRFGSETLRLVEAVTNDYQDSYSKENQPLEEKAKVYAEHVNNSLTDSSVYLVKLADFVDNATGLYHNDAPDRREKIYRMAYKYLPVVDVFQNKINLLENKVDRENINSIYEQLQRTRVRLQRLVDRGV